MITIQGKATKEGFAIATAAKVDTKNGINGVSPVLLQQGINALKRNLIPRDYPEAAMACDTLVMGMSLKIPGVNTVAIAAESDAQVPGLESSVPCVIGLTGLLDSLCDGDILIVDGNKGIVHIDPDPKTLAHYQQIEVAHEHAHKLFIASEHIPARTQTGEVVYIYGCVGSEAELLEALDGGADALCVDARDQRPDEFYLAVLHAAAGKQVIFEVGWADDVLLRAVMNFAAPNQVSLVFPLVDFDMRSLEAQLVIQNLTEEALLRDIEPPQVLFGAFARDDEVLHGNNVEEPARQVIDLRKSSLVESADKLSDILPVWIGDRDAGDVVLVMGDRIRALENLIKAGARSIAIDPKLVGAAKFVVKSVGLEENI